MWNYTVPQPTISLAELERDEAIALLVALFGGSMQDLVDRLAKRGLCWRGKGDKEGTNDLESCE